MELLGLCAGHAAESNDGIVLDADQSADLTHATASGEVVQDAEGPALGQAGIKQRGTFALGETALASATGEHAPLLAGAIAEGDAEVALAAPAVVRTVGVLAAERAEVVHGRFRKRAGGLT